MSLANPLTTVSNYQDIYEHRHAMVYILADTHFSYFLQIQQQNLYILI